MEERLNEREVQHNAETVATIWGDKHWFCRLEFKREDCWVGVFWRRDRIQYKHTFDVWVCLLPMLPIHFGWCRYDLTPDQFDGKE